MKELILIIADDDKTRSNIFEFLESEDFNIINASDVFWGLYLAKEFQPNLIICNINIHKLNWLGVLQKTRENSKLANIPFIFLTSQTDRDSQNRAIQLGANDYLEKPLKLNNLLKAIADKCQLAISSR